MRPRLTPVGWRHRDRAVLLVQEVRLPQPRPRVGRRRLPWRDGPRRTQGQPLRLQSLDEAQVPITELPLAGEAPPGHSWRENG